MGLGSTAKKVQKLADVAEDTYQRINELKSQLQELRTTVEDTGDRVRSLETEVEQQRALLEALAEAQGLDPEAVRARAGSGDVATDAGEAAAGGTPADGTDAGGSRQGDGAGASPSED